MHDQALRILLVDDDFSTLEIIKTFLQEKHLVVQTAMNGKQALKLLPVFKPDIIISDVMMPIMNGFQLCEEVRKDPDSLTRRIPFIFLSAIQSGQEVRTAFKHGADDYLFKPFTLKDLNQSINAVIDKLQLSEQQALHNHLVGCLEEIPITDVVQIIEMERKQGILEITAVSGDRGQLHFKHGLIIGAWFGTYQGVDAATCLLSVKQGVFRYTSSPKLRSNMAPCASNTILLETARLIDELSEFTSHIPERTDVLQVHSAAFAAGNPPFTDQDVSVLLEVIGDTGMAYGELLKTAPLSRMKTEMLAAKLIAHGYLKVVSHTAAAAGVQPGSAKTRATAPRVSSIVISGCNKKIADWFLNLVSRQLLQQELPNARCYGFAEFSVLSLPGGHELKLFSVRGEPRYHDVWQPFLSNSEMVVYVCREHIDVRQVQYFFNMCRDLEKALFVQTDKPTAQQNELSGQLPGVAVYQSKDAEQLAAQFVAFYTGRA